MCSGGRIGEREKSGFCVASELADARPNCGRAVKHFAQLPCLTIMRAQCLFGARRGRPAASYRSEPGRGCDGRGCLPDDGSGWAPFSRSPGGFWWLHTPRPCAGSKCGRGELPPEPLSVYSLPQRFERPPWAPSGGAGDRGRNRPLRISLPSLGITGPSAASPSAWMSPPSGIPPPFLLTSRAFLPGLDSPVDSHSPSLRFAPWAAPSPPEDPAGFNPANPAGWRVYPGIGTPRLSDRRTL